MFFLVQILQARKDRVGVEIKCGFWHYRFRSSCERINDPAGAAQVHQFHGDLDYPVCEEGAVVLHEIGTGELVQGLEVVLQLFSSVSLVDIDGLQGDQGVRWNVPGREDHTAGALADHLAELDLRRD